MDSFCSKIVDYFRDNDCEETIIALTLRDIFLNDLIYISYTNKWQQYDLKKKQWEHFEIEKLVQNISKVSHFYENDFTNHLENSNLQDIEKFYIKKQLKSIVSYANEKLKRDLFIEKCQDCLKIAS